MGLEKIFDEYPGIRYIMFGGKGGLGKTTFSAATAYWLAKRGKKVLIFSVDPQASLSDIFERDIFGKGPKEVMHGLFAQEIDADQRIKDYQDEIRKKILDRYGLEEVPEEVENYIAAASAEPAMEESAIFDAVVDIIASGGYDYYIYDLVPLGHALYYLSMGSIYDSWITKITNLRAEMGKYTEVVAKMKGEAVVEEDEILDELQFVKKRIRASSDVFTNKEKTCFFFVLTPEEMSIIDTRKAAGLFSKFGVPLSGFILNRVLPHELLNHDIPDYLRNKILSQKKPLKDIKEIFGDKVLGYVPEFERDITGFDMISKVAKSMFGEV